MDNKNNTLKYFAYGSNMAERRLQARIPGAKKLTVAHLENYRLFFHKKGADGSGKCDIAYTGNSSDRVYGVVFEFDAAHKSVLDKIEGPRYVARELELFSQQHHSLSAFLYLVEDKQNHTDPALKPYHWYHHHVLFGARNAGFPEDYINTISNIEVITDPDPKRSELELSIYKESVLNK